MSNPDQSYERMFHAACLDLAAINEALDLDPDDGGAVPILEAIAELKARVAPTEAAAMAATVPAEVTEALHWVDDFIARCNGDDRGACESVNIIRRALAAQAPVAGQHAEPSPADLHDWIDLDERRPEPEVYVLTWNGREVGIDWFGSLKRPRGTDYTHWAPFKTPPGAGAMYGMHSMPPKEEGMIIAGNGVSELGKLMRRQWESRIGVYPDGNPNAAPKGDSNG